MVLIQSYFLITFEIYSIGFKFFLNFIKIVNKKLLNKLGVRHPFKGKSRENNSRLIIRL